MVWATRGHIDDLVRPTMFMSDEAKKFLVDVYSLNPWDILRQFESWACARPKSESFRAMLAYRNRCLQVGAL